MLTVYDKGAQRVTLSNNPKAKGMNAAAHRKEDNFTGQITLYNPATRAELAVLRTYHTQSTAYACLWCYGKNKQGEAVYNSGSGKAGGYGYHRASAAVGEAFEAAGFKLKYSIAGVGDTAIEEAMYALARFMGYRRAVIIKANA